MQKLKAQADFRYGLVHIRDNAESIAFYEGEQREQQEAMRRLREASATTAALLRWSSIVSTLQTAYSYTARFLPWLVLSRMYFLKVCPLQISLNNIYQTHRCTCFRPWNAVVCATVLTPPTATVPACPGAGFWRVFTGVNGI